ncbi:methylmalonyl-CoA mutase family protein [Magnetospirillum molischianum]|uniref:Methylmalonyl-CoA mutase small subunit (MCM-beta) n=1 Tax=Magnetospirillum molischianum DSM 120 TaxID=1150626 RepID=H8FVJ4_MAGML|nr:methylmalonyl-CoA mutase family protein [Magnetospirillum molischianum]CCG42382.1 Methylmalonyl-CoA mutase small subunit (MCM-beta) [Magnetospirillum molischianum DSM 120]
MSDPSLKLASEFPVPDRAQWLALVDKALKGAPFDKKLLTRLYEGIVVQPLYTRTDVAGETDPSGFPGASPFARGGRASGAGVDGWEIRSEHNASLPADANTAILDDLLRGATAIHLRLDSAARSGRTTEAALWGEGGIAIHGPEDLDRTLKGVLLEFVPLSLEAGASAERAAELLTDLWRARGTTPDQARGSFGLDPLGTLATEGRLSAPIEDSLTRMAAVAAATARDWPHATAVGVDTGAYHDAGATATQELAAAMATGTAYLKAMTAAGLDIATALGQIVFTLSVDCDQFLSIAKLRAARMMWARIAEACGAPESARRMRLLARTSRRMMSRRDPWVNLLRTTVAGFAAGVGGADSVAVLPFDAELGPSDAFSRRIARNIQILLKEESSLSQVIDPAGGSWYVETLTRQVAEAAWTEFQKIESAGGMAAALIDGSLAERIALSWAEREKNIAKRKDSLTGISEFPNLHERPVERSRPDLKPLRAEAASYLVGAGSPAEPGVNIAPLPRHRLGEAFEALRDAAEAFRNRTGNWPRLFLANLGPVASHTARATYAKNYFEAGGIETLGNDGFTEVEACVAAFKASGARIVALCGSDGLYESHAVAFAQALKQAGTDCLYLAGNPGERKADYTGAGVDEFIFVGCDVLATLRTAHARLGVCA